VRFFRFFVPCPVKLFSSEKLPDAEAWIRE
jgi:hypothetical protein